MVGELVLTAADEATWRRSAWDVVCRFGEAALRGGTVGAVTGGVVGGGMEALGAFVQRSRLQSLVEDLDRAGIPRNELDALTVDQARLVGQLDAAFASGNVREADRILDELEKGMDPGRLDLVEGVLIGRHLGAGELHDRGLSNVAAAAELMRPGFRATDRDLAEFRDLCEAPGIADHYRRTLGGDTFEEWYDAIVDQVGWDHPAVTGLTPEELVAVYGYTTNFYRDLNGTLRSLDEDALDELLPFLRAATSGLNGMPGVQGVFTRRLPRARPAVDELLRPGNVFSDRAFFSSSLRSDLTRFGRKYVITIHGHSGAPVMDFSAFPEEEVLFAPGTRFRVDSRVERGGSIYVTLVEL